jgi:mRNA-degrading endonuclease toxin of MazEF toxin-antitoxin module
LAAVDPTIGSEIQQTRPCLVVSPAEMNDYLRTSLAGARSCTTPLIECRSPTEEPDHTPRRKRQGKLLSEATLADFPPLPPNASRFA